MKKIGLGFKHKGNDKLKKAKTLEKDQLVKKDEPEEKIVEKVEEEEEEDEGKNKIKDKKTKGINKVL